MKKTVKGRIAFLSVAQGLGAVRWDEVTKIVHKNFSSPCVVPNPPPGRFVCPAMSLRFIVLRSLYVFLTVTCCYCCTPCQLCRVPSFVCLYLCPSYGCLLSVLCCLSAVARFATSFVLRNAYWSI